MPTADTPTKNEFDGAAAVTRSMLGWGVVAGPFYLVFGLVLALTRPGFDLSRDALSLLLLGDLGWLQLLNLGLAGVMTLVAAIGLARTPAWSRVAAVLVGVYGVCLVLSAFFPPDATGAFPPGTSGGVFTTSGMLHLVFGGLGFVCLGAAAIVAGSWAKRHVSPTAGILSRIAGIVVIVAFAAGGALSGGPAGVALLWLAVLAGWAWLALISVAAYRAVPHPLLARRPVEAKAA
ncbi:DUF998 domain-containing protein [Herbiconiux moechotypicola]|uniref:DUF998 domain-containing protein n=1 Tax=Herbiconiux moechotypicola TaxID=637393 RepID=A0ABN3DLE8_9MICO|nr:DUF998 domain-containing protein [Herbiconiux moechotypicola]MCS5730154.1 DUF998 domain-containing protein [Herbiconiux moechotypicola]